MLNHQNQFMCAEPPVESEEKYKRMAARLLRQARQLAGRRPWRAAFRVVLTENEDLPKHGKPRLTCWVIADNCTYALWAGAVLGDFHQTALSTCPQVSRIVVTSPTDGRSGFAPRIVWKSRRRQPNERRAWSTEFRDFETSLCSAIVEPAPVRDRAITSTDILAQIGRSPAIQWEAIIQLVKHADAQGFLDCTVEEALRILDLSCTVMPVSPDGTLSLTRWRAIKILVEKGRLQGFVGRQRPLRPHGTAAMPGEILDMVSTAFGIAREQIAGPRRTTALLHPRYVAATIMRGATSRSLIEIGSELGGRDHASVINGLDRMGYWSDIDPIHGKLLDVLVQVADNFGIMKNKDYRLIAISELEHAKETAMARNGVSAVNGGLSRQPRQNSFGDRNGGRRSNVIPLSGERIERLKSRSVF